MNHMKSNDLISRSALLDSFDVCKVTEYDESGCGVDYLAVSVAAIKNAPAVDAVSKAQYDDLYAKYCKLAHATNEKMPKLMGMLRDFNAICAEPVRRWISVDEKQPEPYHTYLVVIKMKHAWENKWEYHVDVADMVDECGYIEDQWNTFNDWDEGQEIHITHWMPLPEIPKEVVHGQ